MSRDCPDEAVVLDFVEGRLADADEMHVREHIAECAPCRELVANVVDTHSRDSSPGRDAVAADLMRGEMIGRYTVLAREGAGGMGAVYSAYDPELDRKIAIKLLRTPMHRGDAHADPAAPRARMAREAKAMARVQHPNVVAVYDVGNFGDELFIAMELVVGTTLAVWRRAATRSWREILVRYLHAGEGLAAAHRAGLVHRDFKPDNVLVRAIDDRVLVADFGLVRMHASVDELTTAVAMHPHDGTSTASFVGTPKYMAPEQRAGESVDARADQFSFCRALEEALFEQGDANAPTWLRAPLARGQSTAPADRWPAMDALLAALRRDPVQVRRRRLARASVAVLAGALVLGTWRSWITAAPACPEPTAALAGVWDDAVREKVRAAFAQSERSYAADTHARVEAALSDHAERWSTMRRDACEATKVRGEQSEEMLDLRIGCLDRQREAFAALTELLSDASTTDVDQALGVVGSLPSPRACADTEALRSAAPLPDDPEARAAIERLFAELARAQTRQYMLGDAPAALERVQALAAEVEQLDHAPLQYKLLSLLSDLQDLSGDRPSAEESIVAALDAATRAHDDRGVATALVKLVAIVGVGERRFAEARIAARITESTLLRLRNVDETRAALWSVMGLVARLEGRYADAAALHERALALLDAAEDATIGERAAERSNFAAALIAVGKHADAQARLDEALVMLEQELGAAHPLLGSIHMNIGYNHAEQDDRAGARAAYERAIAIWERAYGPDHMMVADVLDNLSTMEVRDGLLAQAQAHSERAIAIFTRTLGTDHTETGDAILNFGNGLHRQGRLDEAATQYERALAIHEKALGADHVELAYDLTSLGECRLDQGRVDDAIPLLERALALRERSDGNAKLAERTREILARARRGANE